MRILGRSKYDRSTSRLGFRVGLDFWSCEVECEEDDASGSPVVVTVVEGAVVVAVVASTSIATLSVDRVVVVPDSSVAGVGSAAVEDETVESIWASSTDEVKESALVRFVGDVVLVVVDGSFVI